VKEIAAAEMEMPNGGTEAEASKQDEATSSMDGAKEIPDLNSMNDEAIEG
jgi:hypothetical protein